MNLSLAKKNKLAINPQELTGQTLWSMSLPPDSNIHLHTIHVNFEFGRQQIRPIFFVFNSLSFYHWTINLLFLCINSLYKTRCHFRLMVLGWVQIPFSLTRCLSNIGICATYDEVPMGYHQLLVSREGNFVVPLNMLKVVPWWPTGFPCCSFVICIPLQGQNH